MISFINSPTEQTTAATDLLLSILSLIVVVSVYRTGILRDRKKAMIWVWAFTFLTLASALGAIAHGFEMAPDTNFIIWQPLNLSLGLTVALFVSGVIYDFRKSNIPLYVLIFLIIVAFVFYAITAVIPGTFFIFIIYEAVAMLFSLIIYLILSIRRRSGSYALMATGIFISIVAAVIQAIESVKFTFIFEFDHNGTFHLIQMVGLVFLLSGLRSGFLSTPRQIEKSL